MGRKARGAAHIKRMQKAAWSPAARAKRAATMAAKKETTNGASPPLDLSKLKPASLLKTKPGRKAPVTFTLEQVIALLRGLV